MACPSRRVRLTKSSSRVSNLRIPSLADTSRRLVTRFDWPAFADAWRGEYQPSMEEVRAIGQARLGHPSTLCAKQMRAV
jgi:hypothetical protein